MRPSSLCVLPLLSALLLVSSCSDPGGAEPDDNAHADPVTDPLPPEPAPPPPPPAPPENAVASDPDVEWVICDPSEPLPVLSRGPDGTIVHGAPRLCPRPRTRVIAPDEALPATAAPAQMR